MRARVDLTSASVPVQVEAVARTEDAKEMQDYAAYFSEKGLVRLSAGLVRPLSRRWNLEFELGLGVVWADWERYRCVNCGKRTGKGSGVYVTPTRTAVNLVYLF